MSEPATFAEKGSWWWVRKGPEWIALRARIVLAKMALAKPAVLGRRIAELGSSSARVKGHAAKFVLTQLSPPILWPYELRAKLHAGRPSFEAGVEGVPRETWSEIVVGLDARGSHEADTLARATAYVCGACTFPEVQAALAERVLARVEEDELTKPRGVPPSGAFVLAAGLAELSAAVPGLRRALLTRPADWERQLVPALEAIGTFAAVEALAAFWVTREQKAWSSTRGIRRAAYARLGHEPFFAGESSSCAGARLLALEAELATLGARRRFERTRAGLDDPSSFVRTRAIRLLGHVKGEAREPAKVVLRELLARELDGSERRALAFALTALGDDQFLDSVRAYAANDARVRALAETRAREEWAEFGAFMRKQKRLRGPGEQCLDLLEQLLDGD